MPNQPPVPAQLPVQAQLTYVGRPEISETFANSLYRISFDAFQVRMEFVVNRLDDPKPQTPPTGKSDDAWVRETRDSVCPDRPRGSSHHRR